LGCVGILDVFSPTCRDFGQWLLHNTMYDRIKAKGRRLGWLQRLTAAIHG